MLLQPLSLPFCLYHLFDVGRTDDDEDGRDKYIHHIKIFKKLGLCNDQFLEISIFTIEDQIQEIGAL